MSQFQLQSHFVFRQHFYCFCSVYFLNVDYSPFSFFLSLLSPFPLFLFSLLPFPVQNGKNSPEMEIFGNHPLCELVHSPDSGRGLVAKQDILTGTIVYENRASLIVVDLPFASKCCLQCGNIKPGSSSNSSK